MRAANPPTTSTAIEAFEVAHNIKLPDAYRRFLLETNGGVPANDAYPVESYPHGSIGIIQSFKGIGVDIPTDELAYAYELYDGGIPEKILPIAGNGGGSFVCLDLRDGTDRVVFWDHRHFWSTGEWREQDFYHIADSFAEFLELLRPNPY